MTEAEAKKARDEAFKEMTADPSKEKVDRYLEAVKNYDQTIDEVREAEKKSMAEKQKADAQAKADMLSEQEKKTMELSEAVKFGAKLREALSNGVNFNGDTPVEVSSEIVTKRNEISALRSLCTVHPATGDYAIPVEGDGVAVNYVAENAAIGEANPSAPATILRAYKLAALVKVAREATEDVGFDMVSWLVDLFGRSFAQKEEAEFVAGTGAGENHITGILTAITNASQIHTAASATKLTYEDLMHTIEKAGAYLGTPNDAIIMNRNTLTQIKLLQDGGGHYIFPQGMPLTEIDGLKVCVVPSMPNIATGTTPIIVGNMSYYHIADRRGFNVRTLYETFAVNDQVGLVGTERIDAAPTQQGAFAVCKMG